LAAHERAPGRIPPRGRRCAPAGTRTWARRASGTPTPRGHALPRLTAPILLERGVAGVAVDTLSLDRGG
jgi:hypothetical protein